MTASYTPGVISGNGGVKTLLDQAAVDAAYRVNDGYITRSTAHSIHRFGGMGQRALDNGERLFSGNAGTDFGSLVDAAIPLMVCGQSLSANYVVPPEDVLSNGARRGKPYTEWKASLPAGARECTADEFFKIDRICCNTAQHPVASELLDSAVDMQGSVRFQDEDGHKRKALADGMTPDLWWDFKTTRSEWPQLWRSFVDYGYLWQSAWYSDAAVASGMWERFNMPFIVAQTFAPFSVRVFTLPEELLEKAREEIARTLDVIRMRRSLGVYAEAADMEVVELEFPKWIGGANDG
jgi:hypothetical protein